MYYLLNIVHTQTIRAIRYFKRGDQPRSFQVHIPPRRSRGRVRVTAAAREKHWIGYAIIGTAGNTSPSYTWLIGWSVECVIRQYSIRTHNCYIKKTQTKHNHIIQIPLNDDTENLPMSSHGRKNISEHSQKVEEVTKAQYINSDTFVILNSIKQSSTYCDNCYLVIGKSMTSA